MLPRYDGDRTVVAFLEYLKKWVKMEETMKTWHPRRVAQHVAFHKEEHAGCEVSGYVMAHRVPGNFHIEARSIHHDLNPTMTNVSHVVNHLSFGKPISSSDRRKIASMYPQFTADHPLDGRAFVNKKYHEAIHHYAKVVSTHFEIGGMLRSLKEVLGYQFLAQSSTMHYGADDVPEAKFSYDLSPMAVVVSSKGRKWYDFITSLCAIIGGTFTVISLLDSVLYKAFKGKKQF